MCKKNVVKNAKTLFLKTPFWGTSKNWRLDLKVCADPLWLLVLKMVLKSVLALKITE